jgi:hypothetical protein
MVRILGSTGSRRRRRYQLTAIFSATLLLALLAALPAQAVHDTGAFQLDGDASSATTPIPSTGVDDWDKVCHQVTGSDCDTSSDTTGATAVAWSAEPSPNSSFFTGGGSKDPNDVSAWAWKDLAGGLPDKDNLEHGFAVRYSLAPSATCPSGGAPTCEVIYFGSDRFDNSGDAQQGVWFFQNKITLGGNKIGGGTSFACEGSCSGGFHLNGDVLVVSDFSNGGGTSTITVYKWDTACTATNKPFSYCADANLHQLETSTAANCATVGTADGFCGLVNANTITMPWSFTDKSGTPSNGALNGEFYEAGLNLSTLGLASLCFASTLDESRSSTSTTATLKDFVLSTFGGCGASLKTQVSATTINLGQSVTDDAIVSVTGAGTPPAPTGIVSFFGCGPGVTTCDTTGTAFDTKDLSGAVKSGNDYKVTSAAFTPTAAGTYCFAASWPGDSNYTGGPYRDDGTNECFLVRQPTAITTAQRWLPNDSATVTPAVAGTVVFSLYESGDCTGTVKATFTDSSAPYTTDNSTVYTSNQTISWRAVFTPDDANNIGSTSHCERSDLTINNDIGS